MTKNFLSMAVVCAVSLGGEFTRADIMDEVLSLTRGVVTDARWSPIPPNPNLAFYRELAEVHAPVAYQELGVNPKADYITRFDFDGDLIANNNWDNLDKFQTPAYVYYSVIESETHYFINYGFFHPRDYSNVCLPWICHEDDMEGLTLTVLKDGSKYGVVKVLETLAHNEIATYPDPYMVPVTGRDGRTEMHAGIRIEKQGHGIHGYVPSREDERVDTLAFFPGGKSDTPGRGAPIGHFSYELLSTETELWNRQNLMGKGSMFMSPWNYDGTRFKIRDLAGAFAGEKYKAGLANPPWAWIDNAEKVMKKGDWFFDPALWISRRVKLQEPVSLKYIYNPYVVGR